MVWRGNPRRRLPNVVRAVSLALTCVTLETIGLVLAVGHVPTTYDLRNGLLRSAVILGGLWLVDFILHRDGHHHWLERRLAIVLGGAIAVAPLGLPVGLSLIPEGPTLERFVVASLDPSVMSLAGEWVLVDAGLVGLVIACLTFALMIGTRETRARLGDLASMLAAICVFPIGVWLLAATIVSPRFAVAGVLTTALASLSGVLAATIGAASQA